MIPTIPDGTYGSSTPTIQGILAQAAGIQPFPITTPEKDAAASTWMQRQLTRLDQLFPDHQPLSENRVVVRSGDLTAFDRISPPIEDTEGWGDPMGVTLWGRRLVDLANDVADTITRTPALAALALPPLWPHGHRLNIIGEILFDSPPPSEFRADPRWAMLLHVQSNFYHLLQWALALPATARDSPFGLLWQCHRSGYYPLGTVDGAFVVFTHRPSAA